MLRSALIVAVPETVAETYAALGRKSFAREHALLAQPLLREADLSFEGGKKRATRLRRLAGEQ
jgi:hypothetical protein